MKRIFYGSGVALVTPFKNGKIDFQSMGNMLENCIKEGTKAIVILATTGEGATVERDERRKVIEFCKEKIDGKAKMIVGTGNNNFSTCFSLTKEAKDMGADGALVVTPYYNKTTQAGLVKFYKELGKTKFPMIIYNVPSRTGLNVELDTVEKIIDANEFVYGIKESTCDINRIIKLHQICKDKIAIYSGEDELNYVFYCLGASGCISVTANAFPRHVQMLFEMVKERNMESARELQKHLSPINNILFCETNPIPIKYMLKEMGLIENDEVRLPLVKLSRKNKSKTMNLLKSLDDQKNTP